MLSYLAETEGRQREELVDTWRHSLTQYAKLHSQEVRERTLEVLDLLTQSTQ